MIVNQFVYQQNQWNPPLIEIEESQLVLVFGDRNLYRDTRIRGSLKARFPGAIILGCTTSGEICGTEVMDNTLVASVLSFSKTQVRASSININDYKDSEQAGIALAKSVEKTNLKYLLVISDGQNVNGSSLVAGLGGGLPSTTLVTGGMAGDGSRFEETEVWLNDEQASGLIVACGFYGDNLIIGHGSLGGWDTFGPSRLITRATENVLYELDNQNALELYKSYLGEYALELPASALLFPLAVSKTEDGDAVVRTILSIDETAKTMVFAGDMPEGSYTKLMRANFDRLIDGAQGAAEACVSQVDKQQAQFALLISCVGRRLVLNQRVEEELEQVREVLGDNCVCGGFYSYGEISPLLSSAECRLHNQTMTITTFSESVDA